MVQSRAVYAVLVRLLEEGAGGEETLLTIAALYVAVQGSWPRVPQKAERLLSALIRVSCMAASEINSWPPPVGMSGSDGSSNCADKGVRGSGGGSGGLGEGSQSASGERDKCSEWRASNPLGFMKELAPIIQRFATKAAALVVVLGGNHASASMRFIGACITSQHQR